MKAPSPNHWPAREFPTINPTFKENVKISFPKVSTFIFPFFLIQQHPILAMKTIMNK